MTLTADIELKHVQFDNIPDELKSIDTWVLWRAEKRTKKDGTEYLTKIPMQTSGGNAGSTLENTWASYEEVKEAYESGKGEGVGIILNGRHDLFVLDIDDTTESEHYEHFKHATYCELSPSGNGIHIYMLGDKPKEHRSVSPNNNSLELFSDEKFITVTGDTLTDIDYVAELNSHIENLIKNEFPPNEYSLGNINLNEPLKIDTPHHDLTKEEVMKIMSGSKFKNEISALMKGDISIKDYDHSSADWALASQLAFWTARDEQMSYEIFTESGLYSNDRGKRKTDEQYDLYVRQTIRKAILTKKKVFEPQGSSDYNFTFLEEPEQSLPRPYYIDHGFLYKKVIKGKGDNAEEVPVYISREVPRILYKLEDIENGDSYHLLEFENVRKKSKKTIQVPTKTIAYSRDLIELSTKGFSINSNNASELVNYFDKYESFTDIESKKTFTRLGHIKGHFVHPAIDNGYEIIAKDNEYQKMIDSFKTKGTLEDYQKEVFSLVNNSTTALFMIYSSLASLLLEHFKIDPLIVDLHGNTSIGKTVMLKVLASLFGNHEKLVMTWDSTEYNINQRAVFLNTFPLLIDDTQKAKFNSTVNKVVYQFSSGLERGRGKPDGLAETKEWRNILISTGENAITSFGENKGGQAPRTITIDAAPFNFDRETDPDKKTDFFRNIHKGIDNQYGTLAIEFYNQFESNKKYYKDAFEDFETDFRKRTDIDTIQRLGRAFAVIKLAGLILDEIKGFESDFEGVCDVVFDDMVKSNTALDKPMEILDNLLAELDSKRAFLLTDGDYPGKTEMIGGIKSEFVGVFPSYLNKLLGHEKNAVIKEWKERGWLVLDKSKESNQKSVKFGKTTRRMYCIDSFITRKLGYDFQAGVTGRSIREYESSEYDST